MKKYFFSFFLIISLNETSIAQTSQAESNAVKAKQPTDSKLKKIGYAFGSSFFSSALSSYAGAKFTQPIKIVTPGGANAERAVDWACNKAGITPPPAPQDGSIEAETATYIRDMGGESERMHPYRPIAFIISWIVGIGFPAYVRKEKTWYCIIAHIAGSTLGTIVGGI